MKTCPYCGAEVPAGDLYCGECGRKVEAAPPPSTTPPTEERRGFPVLPVAIGAGVILCLCIVVVGVLFVPDLISQPTPTVSAGLPTRAIIPTEVLPMVTATKVAPQTPTPTVTPSPTQRPTSTFTPTPIPIPGSLLYEEDFENQTNGWWTSSETDYEVDYIDGEYVFFIATEDYGVWSWGGEYFEDFILNVEAGQLSGPDPNSYGVLFRFQDSDNFYRFAISGEGQYAVHRKLDGEWEDLMPWTDSPAINAGAAWNLLRVACQGPYMNFYVNGVHVAHVIDSTFSGGDIGLHVGTSVGYPNLEVAFDNVQVWYNDAPQATAFEFKDDFDKQLGGWDTDLSEGREAGYENDRFEISILESDTIGWSRPYKTFDDFAAEVEVRKIAGPNVNAQGIAFRVQDSKNFYAFTVSSTGQYRITKAVDNEWTYPVDWLSSAEINKGEEVNHLRVVCRGSQLSFYVNGAYITGIEDTTFADGDVALWAQSYDDVPVTIHFDDFKLWLFD
ncbi:MAG: hypothetical protein SVX38_02310 [Chloroflexota bacterium]|nr:hypothetical protein [Chloroflexota bacterium]